MSACIGYGFAHAQVYVFSFMWVLQFVYCLGTVCTAVFNGTRQFTLPYSGRGSLDGHGRVKLCGGLWVTYNVLSSALQGMPPILRQL